MISPKIASQPGWGGGGGFDSMVEEHQIQFVTAVKTIHRHAEGGAKGLK